MSDLTVRGRSFRTPSDYRAALRDEKLIESIETALNREDLTSVKAAIDKMTAANFRFETLVGEDYFDELVSLERSLRFKKTETVDKDKKQKKQKKNKKKTVSFDEYDTDMQTRIVREMKRLESRRKLILVILFLCISGSLLYLVYYFMMYRKNTTDYNALAELITEDKGQSELVINYTDEPDARPVLAKYAELLNRNKKIVGWLTIEGCDIDYPVLQTVNNDYYLDHNFDQEYDKNGAIFMDYQCDPAHPNDNMIIYGHHMKSGKMFGNLNRYASYDFFNKNKTFTFDTIYEEGTYEVAYVFRSKIYNEDEIRFKYYQFIDVAGSDEFDSNMEQMDMLSLYDTGVTPFYGDKLITLSTCDSSERDGRFVVVARKID